MASIGNGRKLVVKLGISELLPESVRPYDPDNRNLAARQP